MFNNIKKIFFIILLSSSIILTWFLTEALGPEQAMAGSGDNVKGWAWSENIGWISFNCENPESGGICADVGDWGVNIDENNNFSGYAWSDNVGWISFQESSTPPDNYDFNSQCPNLCDSSNSCTACFLRDSNRKVYGWAKILNMGDDGWIHLQKGSSAGGFTYGVSIDTSGDFSGWAWNNNDNGHGIGWISFNCADSGAGGCSVSDYKVTMTISVNITSIYPMTGDKCGTLHIEWTGTAEEGYIVERDGSDVSPILEKTTNVFNDSGLSPGSTHTYIVKACKNPSCTQYNTSDSKSGTTQAICSIGSISGWGECANTIHLSWNEHSEAEDYSVHRTITGESETTIVTGGCPASSGIVCNGGVCTYDDTIPAGSESKRVTYRISGWDCDAPIGEQESDKFGPSAEIVACPKAPVWKEVKPQ